MNLCSLCEVALEMNDRNYLYHFTAGVVSLSFGYMGNFSLAMAMQFSETIALHLQIEKLPEYSEFPFILQFFRSSCIAIARLDLLQVPLK